jgi:hypothetical protein
MKKPTKKKGPKDELRARYDFSKGIRGKHFNRYWEGTNVVLLAPDVAKVFKSSEAVNAALRKLIAVGEKAPKGNKRSGAA